MVAPGPTQARIIQSVQHPMKKREGPGGVGPPWPILIFAVDAIFRRRNTAIIVAIVASYTVVGMKCTHIKY